MQKLKTYNQTFNLQGATIIVESNRLARLSDQSFLIYWNKSTVLVTVCIGKEKSKNNWLPLTVDFQDNLYAAGKIPGSFFRREGKPSDFAVHSGRLIDRSIRNIFPKNFRNDVQIIVEPLSVDYSIDIRTVSLFAVSLALNCSSLPFSLPIAGVVVACIKGEFKVNPTEAEMADSELEMFVSGTKDKINIIEISANQLPEDQILKAIELAHSTIIELLKIEEKVIADFPKTKADHFYEEINPDFHKVAIKKYKKQILALINDSDNQARDQNKSLLLKEIINDHAGDSESFCPEMMSIWFESVIREELRTKTIKDKSRIDGRKFEEIRPIDSAVDLIPVVHGSGLFSRGLTQTLSIITLGPMSDNQLIDDLTKEQSKRFIYHYKSLPFSFGQVSSIRGVSRRETGHGYLGYKALKWVLPSSDDFPYTLRVVSEVMSSNGSTSQASICSASLGLMAAGVPLTGHVAGTATGLIKQDDQYHLLTDIQAWEDFYGDMDFKIAGTKKGVCSVQIDLKIDGLPLEVIKKIFQQAQIDRTKILEIMEKTIAQPRSTLGEDVIKFKKFKVDPTELGGIIGPGGKNIKRVISETDNSSIDVNDDGTILIYHKNELMVAKAQKMLLTPPERPSRNFERSSGRGRNFERSSGGGRNFERSSGRGRNFERSGGGGRNFERSNDDGRNSQKNLPKIGDQLNGKVINLVEYGAFIELDDTQINGLLHISELKQNEFVKDIHKELKINQRVFVEVIKINERKQVGLKLIKKL